jgi:oxygen-dependent protoporphyrinogen oxidase
MENNSQSQIRNTKSVVIIGAGISGLCVAYWLKKKGFDVTVLEKDEEPGGTMKTLHDHGWLIESGPNSALETTPLLKQLFGELGILDQSIYASGEASNRYIVRDGKLNSLPMNIGTFLTTKLWTAGGKLRLFKEPFIGRAMKEETVAEFVERRLGKEFLDYGINPFVAGVYAGNPEELSVRAAFPKLYSLEEKYGGLVKGMIGSRKERKERKEIAKDRAKLFSFLDGMQVFPDSIAEHLGNSLKLNCSVEQIIPRKVGNHPVYSITYTHNGERESVESETVVLAAPARSTASIIRPIDPEMAKTLESIYYPPVAEVFLGFKSDQIERPLDGFGFLVPEVEHRKILGTIWSSILFPKRSPADCIALTTFVGGARQPELTTRNDEQITTLVLEELRSLMGIEGRPVYSKIIRWDKAIPQYNLGYQKILDKMERFEQNYPGTFICSNYRGGIAVGDCVMNAEITVTKIETMINSSPL